MDFVASHGSFLAIICDFFDYFSCNGQLGNLIEDNKTMTKVLIILRLQVNSEAKYDDNSITVRNSEVSYGLFNGELRRFFLGSLSYYNLQSKNWKVYQNWKLN